MKRSCTAANSRSTRSAFHGCTRARVEHPRPHERARQPVQLVQLEQRRDPVGDDERRPGIQPPRARRQRTERHAVQPPPPDHAQPRALQLEHPRHAPPATTTTSQTRSSHARGSRPLVNRTRRASPSTPASTTDPDRPITRPLNRTARASTRPNPPRTSLSSNASRSAPPSRPPVRCTRQPQRPLRRRRLRQRPLHRRLPRHQRQRRRRQHHRRRRRHTHRHRQQRPSPPPRPSDRQTQQRRPGTKHGGNDPTPPATPKKLNTRLTPT